MKDKLSELIQSAVGGCAKYWADVIADKLISEGVIVPPVKVGDKAYHLTGIDTRRELDLTDIFEGKVCSISKQEDALWIFCRYDNGLTYWYTESDIGRKLFLTREEAEKALERSENETI
jgi:hypothetical protein